MSIPIPSRTTRVIIVDDSPLLRELLSRTLALDPTIEVAGMAENGAEAADLARRLRPDVITMDLEMPESDGFSGIARIMDETPTPILVLTGNREEKKNFRALSLGAIDLMEKPGPQTNLDRFGESLRSRVKLLTQIRAIRHPRGRREEKAAATRKATRSELIVIGSSLGGPRALATLLAGLPESFPVPIAIVQHISDGFTEGLASWLDAECKLVVKEATDGMVLRPGEVLVGPSGHHLLIGHGVVRLSDAPPIDTFRPSVTPLFSSAAYSYGSRACGVILTGMGNDGTAGMKELHASGAITIAQDEATCTVFGMPKAAIDAGTIDRILPLDEIPRALIEVVR